MSISKKSKIKYTFNIWITSISTFFSFVFGVISFIQPSIITDYIYVVESPIVFGLVCWLLSAISLLFLLVFETNHRRKKEINNLIEAFFENSKGRGFIQHLGNSTDCMSLIAARISIAKSVQNTFVGLQNTHSNHIIQSYEKWFQNSHKGTWVDIVTIREYFSQRYIQITVDDPKGLHEMYVLRHFIPIPNFVILEHEEGFKEVYWGWLPGESESQLFRSYDTNLIDNFQSYFNELKKRTWNQKINRGDAFSLDYSTTGQNRLPGSELGLIDKQGTWITLSYPNRKRTKIDNVLSINRFGIINFEITELDINVKTKIYESDGTLDGTSDVNAEDDIDHPVIAHYTNNVFVGYKLEDTSGTAVCHYQFRRKDGIDIIQGLYLDRKSGIKNTLVGIRITDDLLADCRYNFETNISKEELFKLLETAANIISRLNNFENLVKGPNFDA